MMIVEEKKAREYECPQKMMMSDDVHCTGSRCMAWRWVNPLDEEYTYLFDEAPDREKTYGYCGLAGGP